MEHEDVVVAALEFDEGGGGGEAMEGFGVGEGDDLVGAGVEEEDGAVEGGEDAIGAEGVLDDEGGRAETPGEGGDAFEGGFEDECGGRVDGGELGGDAGAKGAAVVDEARGVDVGAFEEELAEAEGVGEDGVLRGRAGGAAVATVFEEEDAVAASAIGIGEGELVVDEFGVAVGEEDGGGGGGG